MRNSDPDPHWDLSFVLWKIGIGSIKRMRNSDPWDLSCISKKIRVRKNQLLLASESRFQLQLKQKQRKNHERKIQDPPWGNFQLTYHSLPR